MENYKERLERLYRETETSLDKKKLQEADRELRELLLKKGEFALNDDLRKIADALYFRNRARAFLVNFAGGFGAERYRKMKESLSALQSKCPEDLGNTVHFIGDAGEALDAAQNAVGRFEKIPHASMSEEELKQALSELKHPDTGTYSAEFGFLKDSVIEYLAKKSESVESALSARCQKRYGEDYRRCVKPTAEFIGYDYYPAGVENEESAKCAIVVTPYREEAAFYAAAVSKTEREKSLSVDLKKLSGASEGFREFLFKKLEDAEQQRILFLDFSALAGEAKGSVASGIKALIQAEKRVAVHDDGAERNVFKLFREEGLSEVRSVFLSVPDYEEAKETLSGQGFFSERGDEALFRKYGVYLGFVGLNELLRAGRAAWRRTLKKYASERKEKFDAFLEKLPNRALLIDDGWKFEPAYRAPETKEVRAPYTFDYDKMREFRPENLRKILEGGDSLLAKCGMAAKYCILLGEDDSRWKELGLTDAGKAERIKRLKTATGILSELLGTETKSPEVEVVSEENWEKAHEGSSAYCVNGGEKIVFREKYLDDTEELPNTVLHEMYHSFQQTAIASVFKSWWRTDLSVTPERVKEWAYNFGEKRYIGARHRNAYYVQVVEVDARIFAAVALRACGERWSELDLI